MLLSQIRQIKGVWCSLGYTGSLKPNNAAARIQDFRRPDKAFHGQAFCSCFMQMMVRHLAYMCSGPQSLNKSIKCPNPVSKRLKLES